MFETFITDPKKSIQAIIRFLQSEIIRYNLNSLVLGVSGGADSTLVAALAHEAIKNMRDVQLIGYSLPSLTNKDDEIKRADEVITAFCDYGSTINISEIANAHIKFCELGDDESNLWPDINSNEHELKVRAGNIKARIRMIFLYDTAKQFNGVVLSTDNLTEYMLGFWTRHGDEGDLAPIQNLWKSEVYDVMETLANSYELDENNKQKAKVLRDGIVAKPTDGLGVSNSDFDQFGYYPDVLKRLKPKEVYRLVEEEIIEYLLASEADDKVALEELKQNQIVQRHINSNYKRECVKSPSRNTLT